MKLGFLSVAVLCFGCGGASALDLPSNPDSGSTEASVKLELVCGPDFCGNITDKNTGITADCGSCQTGSVCGDNGVANVCGNSCVPSSAPTVDGGSFDVSPACTYALGPNWWAGYASHGVQLEASCRYVDPYSCVEIDNPWPSDGVCSGTVCGWHWCCLDDPAAGIDYLLPGAVAGDDGGLP